MSLVIEKTMNYDLFKFSEQNRNIKKGKVEEIKESISEIGSKLRTCPIIVDENYTITDGQHRFVAHKELKLPIFYIKDNDAKMEDVPFLNYPQTRWLLEDYVKHQVSRRNPNYMYLIELKERYKTLALSTFCNILNAFKSDGKYKTRAFMNKFRKGLFVIDPEIKPALEHFLDITVPVLRELHRLKSGSCGFLYTPTYIEALAKRYMMDEELYLKLLSKLPDNYDKLIGFTCVAPLNETLDRIMASRKRRLFLKDEEVA